LGELPSAVSFLSIGSSALSTEALLATCEGEPVHAVPYPHDGWVTLDIVSERAGKGEALAALAASLGLAPASCAAVGDYLNDIPMLEWAGWAVAMGQAPHAVRDVADAVVATSAEHGAAQALLAIAAAR
jgi:hydroxymethylpyrimidine pyrophosphatase-like HAD family hydrolase